MAQVYGGTLGLIAFVAVVMRGLVGGSLASATLLAACLSLALFFLLGCVIGWMSERALHESVRVQIESYIDTDQAAATNAPAPSES